MEKIQSPDSSFQQRQVHEEKPIGQELLRLIYKLSYTIVKGFFFITYFLSSSFRQKKTKLSSSLNSLSKLNPRIDNRLIEATIKIEDKRFNLHYGHDVRSIFRAIINNRFNKRIQGASTIEQQLVRIILEINSMTIKRKIIEILFSAYLNKKYTKSEIIKLYLSNYHFSKDKIGIKELCQKEGYNYLNLSYKDICEIVARIKYPNVTATNYIRYLKRVRTIEIITNTIQL